MKEQYYHTTNTKLAVALATLGAPFHNDAEPAMAVRDHGGIQTVWRFALGGIWRNFDGSETVPFALADAGKAWVSPTAGNLPEGPRRELVVIKKALESRDLLQQILHAPSVETSYIGQAIRENSAIMERVIKEALLVKLRTKDGRILYVPNEGAADHADHAAKVFGVRV